MRSPTFDGYWAQRAGEAERQALDAVVLMVRCRARYTLSMEPEDVRELDRLIANQKRLDMWRANPLPAGPTLIGNLTSGGIDV